MRRLFLGLVISLALPAAGCGGKEKGAGGGGFQMPPTPVETATVEERRVADHFEAVGSVEASEAIQVVSEINATVVELPFRQGSFLHKGDLIAQLDDSELAAEVARTEALRDQQKATYDRVKLIVEQKAGSPQDLDDAAAALHVAEANLALARARAAKARILAPFDGVVGVRKVSPGAYLRAGETITELAAIRELKITFSAPERYVPRLHRGAQVTVTSPALPNVTLDGTIDVVDPVLDPATRNATVQARVPNPERRFLPGMSADVSVVIGERPSALTIPSEAVFAEGNQFLVYVVKADSTVTRQALTLGARLADAVEVRQGLEAGMRVVATGHQKLYEGAKVMPIPPGGMQGGAGGGPGGPGAPAEPEGAADSTGGGAAPAPAHSGGGGDEA